MTEGNVVDQVTTGQPSSGVQGNSSAPMNSSFQDIRPEFLIFSALFKQDQGVFRRKQEFLTSFNDAEIFRNEYFVFYQLIRNFPKVVPDEHFIRLYLQTNRAILQRSKFVDLASFRVGENDPYVEFVNSCLSLYRDCAKREVSDIEFYRSMEMYKMEYISRNSIQILEEAAIILSEGATIGRQSLSGYNDMRKYLKQRFLKLDNMVNKSERKGLITYNYTDEEEEEENSGRLVQVSTFGIDKLDQATGGIYEGDMVSILAPAKGCKSRFSTYILHNAIVNHGTPVVMWSVENGYKGWEALLRARHFNWFYNRGITDTSQKRFIDADMIRKGILQGELAEMELASWTDLKYNTNYGRFVNIDEDLNLDNFLDVLESAINEVGAKLVCIDYLQLIQGGYGMQKNERIATAYIQLLQFLKRKKVGGIFPAQIKQTVIDEILRTPEEELVSLELRDAASESYEVVKTPDVNIMLFGTQESISQGDMKILSVASRNIAPFKPIQLFVDAGSCTFASVDTNPY